MARKPFPKDLPGLESLLYTWKMKLAAYQSTLGLTATDVSQAGHDHDVLVAFRQGLDILDESIEALRAARRIILKSPEGTPVPGLPSFATITLPAGVLVGIDPRTRNLRQRIFDSKGYNEEVGRDLDLEDDGDTDTIIVPPVLKIKDGLADYEIQVEFKKDGHSSVRFEFARQNASKFNFVNNKSKSPAIIEIPPTTDGAAEVVRIRGIYMDNDEPVGDYSPEYPVTIRP